MVFQKREYRKPRQESQHPSFTRKRKCKFCLAKQDTIDYKDINRLSQFLSERGKILSKRISGNCSKHQRRLAEAIKRARFLALFPSK
ncbi:MAG: 30S ribosomal protein S18 [Candidatus Omnitrophota bacterium]